MKMRPLKQVSLPLAIMISLMMVCTAGQAYGQWARKWLDVGSFQNRYYDGGGFPDIAGSTAMRYPGAYSYMENKKSLGLWIAVKDYTDENGTNWPVRIAHYGPKSNRGLGEMFSEEFETVSRFEAPEVYVDNILSFRNPTFVDRVDPDMKADRMLYNRVNSLVGITHEARYYQFSQEYHDNYHITEYTFTNTGNVDDDPDIELMETLHDVRIGMIHRYSISEMGRGVIGGGAGWGQNTMIDAIGDGHEEYDKDIRAMYVWHGRMPSFRRWDNIGIPVLDDSNVRVQEGDTLGYLYGAHFVGRAYAHVDRSASDPTDDPAQPQTMDYYDADDRLILSNDPFDVPKMTEEYDFISSGRAYPHHADLVEPEGPWDRERFAYQTNDPSRGLPGGWGTKEGFGPFTLAHGESIRIVVVEAAKGLSEEAKREIGLAYRENWTAGTEDAPIDYDANGDGVIGSDESMSKNMWVMTSRDSLIQTFERAIANFKSGFQIPRAPMPPKILHVSSDANRIALEWESYPGAAPRGWEIYRSAERINNRYELIASLGPDENSYSDTDVNRGIDYYYYVQAVGDINMDGTGLTPIGIPLKSNRYYAQTYLAASLKRDAGSTLSDFRIVPNPFNLGSSSSVRWPDQQDKIGFLDIPGRCSIRIYTETGVLVTTIEHVDNSGDAYWNLTTSSSQVVASGIYFAVLQDHDTGEQIVRPFSIIR